MNYSDSVFSVSYAVIYDGWVLQEQSNDRKRGFFNTYKRGDYTIDVTRNNYYLHLSIKDKNNKEVFNGYIKNLQQYRDLKKKLKWK